MAVYIKYKSAKDFDSIPIVHQFISVHDLKLKIFRSKRYGRGKDFDFIISNAQTNEEYIDEQTLIPKSTSVLIRRVPGLPCLPIVITKPEQKDQDQPQVKEQPIAPPECCQDLEFNYFGDDVYSVPELMIPTTSTDNIKVNEEKKMKTLVDAPLQVQLSNGFGWKRPPPGYVCHRCRVPGHFIQHCPTNGDPNYDIKKPSTATPRSVLSGGSSLSSSKSSTSTVSDIPPELFCPICKQVMKDAALVSRCCYSSFCDKCIRDHIVCNSMCICGARNILADTILPNLTLRNTIVKLLESSSSSSSSVKFEQVGQTEIPGSSTTGTEMDSTCKSAESRKRHAPRVVEEEQQMKRRRNFAVVQTRANNFYPNFSNHTLHVF